MMNRREMIQALAVVSAVAPFRPLAWAQLTAPDSAVERLFSYFEALAREDGGYGWEGQGRSHLTPTFFVIGCYHTLKSPHPRAARVAAFLRNHHPAALKKLEQERRIFEWQQLMALTWLGEPAPAELRERILAWEKPLAYLKQYERHGYPLFTSEMSVVLARDLLRAGPLSKEFTAYIESRRRANGSFNNTPASDGSDGHVTPTMWGLLALQTLRRARENRAQAIEWLQSCQKVSGGFTFSPRPEYGGLEDVAYTWAALRALKLLDAEPRDKARCVNWLRSLRNFDGGFGDRPGWSSNPMAAYYALSSFDLLSALGELPQPTPVPAAPRTRRAIPSASRVFSIQLEAPGRGSPLEAVHIARSLRIHRWGAKNASPRWLARAQAIADEQNAPVKFFVSNEEYGTWVDFPGQGTYSHTSDIIAPANSQPGPSVAGEQAVTWAEFRERRLKPLLAAKGRLIWQFGENEELVRMLLDDSIERGGFAAISAFHFGNPDYTNSEPFLHRWRGKIPFVALQDAHGPEPWWFSDMTAGFRTLFIAEEPTWDAWLHALQHHRVAAVRRDQWTLGQTWMHAPSAEVAEFINARQTQWRWWDNPPIERPLVSIVALRPEDEFETARPENGVTLRIRCAWQNTPQGLLKQPISEFLKLTIDGSEQTPELVAKQRPNGLYDDYYHQLRIPDPAPGRHTAVVTARTVDGKSILQKSMEFVYL